MTYEIQSTAITINNRLHSLCPRCQEMKPSHSQFGMYFEGGITVRFLGGYAEYYDPAFSEDEFDGKATVDVTLCHECTVETLKFIGVYNDERFIGGHPAERDADPCCDNCWIPITDGNGKWIGTKYPNGQIHYHRQ